MDKPFISICIPAYKRIEYLKRLLLSIGEQTFTDFEIVLTDDSDNNTVQKLVEEFAAILPIRYYKNQSALGTPENWNAAISYANGHWIKIMHDDDWFSSPNSLLAFVKATRRTNSKFIFSAYQNVYANTAKKEIHKLNILTKWLLMKSELTLFKANYIGNPSCILVHSSIGLEYDNRLKWVVDFEFYMRLLKTEKAFYIPQVLVNVGIHDTMVTTYTFRKPEVELPENHLLLEKMGSGILRNVFVFDYFWRLYRNLNVRTVKDVEKYYGGHVPEECRRMIRFQNRFSPSILKVGPFSKLFMLFNYLF